MKPRRRCRWFQIGGEVSDRQWRDILSVLRGMGRELDGACLDRVCAEGNLIELLARARHDAEM